MNDREFVNWFIENFNEQDFEAIEPLSVEWVVGGDGDVLAIRLLMGFGYADALTLIIRPYMIEVEKKGCIVYSIDAPEAADIFDYFEGMKPF